MRINYNHLRYFWFVAHEGNLTRAAKELAISQSALSVQIKTLEGQLGHPLFERRGRQLVLTEAGQLVLDYADSIFKTGDELLYQLAHNQKLSRRVVRVGALSTLSRNFQIQFLRPLLGKPDVELVVCSGTLGELIAQLENHRIDVVLTTTVPLRDSATRWVAHRIDDQRVSLVGAPEYAEDQRCLEELLGQVPLVLPTVESSIRVAFDAFVERWHIKPKVVAELSDMTMLRLLAREKIGLAVVPPIVVMDELKRGELVEIRSFEAIHEEFYALVLMGRLPNSLVTELLAPH